jgi:hypothetical protein
MVVLVLFVAMFCGALADPHTVFVTLMNPYGSNDRSTWLFFSVDEGKTFQNTSVVLPLGRGSGPGITQLMNVPLCKACVLLFDGASSQTGRVLQYDTVTANLTVLLDERLTVYNIFQLKFTPDGTVAYALGSGVDNHIHVYRSEMGKPFVEVEIRFSVHVYSFFFFVFVGEQQDLLSGCFQHGFFITDFACV